MNHVDKYLPALPEPTPRNAVVDESLAITDIETRLLEMSDLFAHSLDGVFDLEDQPSDPPSAVSDFIARFAKQDEQAADRYALHHDDRRATRRVACDRWVLAVPVSRQFVRIGEPFMAAIQDVSEDGIRLLHTRATCDRYLGLSWQADSRRASRIRVVIKVSRCTARSMFYCISGDFVFAD